MKKEYLILTALIIILCAYLFLHKENRDNYILPEIPKIDTQKITGVVIEKRDTSIVFTKKEDKWTLTDKAYPADKYMIDNMLAIFKNFKLSTLVSQDGDLDRYELDKEKNIRVKLLEGNALVFELTMGKTAPSFNHTFVKLAKDNHVYHASGSFRSNFDNGVDDFRDKKILAFATPSIKRLTVKKGSLSKTLISAEEKNDKDQSVTTWSSEDSDPVDKKAVSDLLSAIKDLDCEKFLEAGKEDMIKNQDQKPVYIIHLENEKAFGLTLYGNTSDENLIGTSSMSKYAFALSQFNGKEIISNIEKLLGIDKAEDKKE